MRSKLDLPARVQGLAEAGEISVSGDAYNFPGVSGALCDCKIASEQANVRGASELLDICRVTMAR